MRFPYIIINTNRNSGDYACCWSNQFGWIEGFCFADMFSEEERSKLRLPLNGEWVNLEELRRSCE